MLENVYIQQVYLVAEQILVSKASDICQDPTKEAVIWKTPCFKQHPTSNRLTQMTVKLWLLAMVGHCSQ